MAKGWAPLLRHATGFTDWHYFKGGRSACGAWAADGSALQAAPDGRHVCRACRRLQGPRGPRRKG